MSRTITAMFDSRSEAEAARDRLKAANIDASRVRIIDQQGTGSGMSGAHDRSPAHEGFWASLKDLFMPGEDRHAYGEGIRRGGYMVAAEVEENQADEACRILDQAGSVDFDQRQSEWRSQGWSGSQADRQAGAFGQLSNDDAYASGRDDDSMKRDRVNAGRDTDEERIPVIEEELRVGKREVERGGARMRSYVREIPVHEQVNLREEHVEVERRPADERLDAGKLRDGDIFREREIEMTEHAEEPVVSKEAHVTEEVIIRKTAEERTETIDDTVRKTEVDVGDVGRGDRSAFGAFKDRDSDKQREERERTMSERDRDDRM